MKFLSLVSYSAWLWGNKTNASYICAAKTQVTLLKVYPASDIDTKNKSAIVENEHPCASLYRVKSSCCSGAVGKDSKFVGWFLCLLWYDPKLY